MSKYLVWIDGAEGGGAARTFKKSDDTELTDKKPIVCTKLQHGINTPVIATSSSRSTGASEHGGVRLTHGVDKASPKLRQMCATKNTIAEVHIYRTGSGGAATLDGDVERIRLANAKIGSVAMETGASADGPNNDPIEVFTIDYEEITWDRKVGAVWTEKGWDCDTQEELTGLGTPVST